MNTMGNLLLARQLTPTCGCGANPALAMLVPALSPPNFVGDPAVEMTARRRLDRAALAAVNRADMVLFGAVRTMNPAAPTADAVAIADGFVVAVGDRADIAGLIDASTELVDIGDGVAYPGLIDPHLHYAPAAAFADWVNCSTRDGMTHADVLDALASSGPVRGDWVLGKQYDPSQVAGQRVLTLDELDEVQPDRPVMVINASMHHVYCNSVAMERAGITYDTPNPVSGFIGRADGKLTGSLDEIGAIALAMAHVPQPSQPEFVEACLEVNRYAASKGLTHTRDAATGAFVGLSEIDLLHAIAPRVGPRISYAVFDTVIDDALERGVHPGQGDAKVWAAAWKLVADGANQGYTGYQIDNYFHKDFRGEPNYDTAYIASRIATATELGWQFMCHANGDAAIAQAIEAYRDVLADGPNELRHRIEHCSFPTIEQLHDMADLGISPSFLMGHLYYWGHIFQSQVMGPVKADRLDPVGTATHLGMHPTMHSDYTVTNIEPMRLVQTAVERKMRGNGEVLNEAECVNIADALAAITINAAWQTNSDDTQGSIEVGKFADFTVLGADPMFVDTAEIADIDIRQTIVGGETVYTAD